MPEGRPDPSELLKYASALERRKRRGKLKIFFGAAPGVGKTYAMLEEARRLYAQGVDVVVGYVEPHRRSETTALTLGLEILPPREVEYRGASLKEFDLDAALARRPSILLLDELAHTNAPGARFGKRHEDTEALLDAGVSVFTTLNVQHVESLSDIVAQIAGVPVRETVPDSIFDDADEVELVDLPPDALLERLREGKVYVPDVARDAITAFFRKGNLSALRELALRRTAKWVDSQVRSYQREHGIARVWPASERILVGIGADAKSGNVLRAAKRLAVELRADLLAVYVETPLDLRLPQAARDHVAQNLRLAESLGAETATLSGQRVAPVLVDYAQSRNVTKIVVGKSHRPAWLERFFGSVAASLMRAVGDLDVYVIHGEAGGEPTAPRVPRPRRRSGWPSYALATAIVAAATGIAYPMAPPRFELTNVAMVYVLAVLVASVACGRGASALASVLSVASFDFFFVTPTWTFAVSDTQYLITFTVMLIVALLISSLTTRIRDQAEEARARERRTASLYAMSRELAAARGEEQVLEIAARHVRETFECSVAVLVPGPDGRVVSPPADRTAYEFGTTDQGAAQWAFDHVQAAGADTKTLPAAQGLYLPLVASQGKVGVLGARLQGAAPLSPNQRHLLETFCHQIALALERARLIRDAQESQVKSETERLRNALLSSVSHDLRTPLAVIQGAASTLLDRFSSMDDASRRALLESIGEESDRLNQIVENLVFATRLESGAILLRKDWIGVEELVGAALRRLRDRLKTRPVRTFLPDDLPLVRGDGALLEQVIVNLLENALRYTPEGSPIEIAAWRTETEIVVRVSDHGPGLASDEQKRVFDRFYRGRAGTGSSGLGLGLYICRGIVDAHGGRIWGESAPAGGAAFHFTLPLEADVPSVPAELEAEAPPRSRA